MNTTGKHLRPPQCQPPKTPHLRVTVLTSDLRYDLGQQTVQVNPCGSFQAVFYNLGYTGPVEIAANELDPPAGSEAAGRTEWAAATTRPELQFNLVGTGGCGNLTEAWADNFVPGYDARFELLNQNLTEVLGTDTTTAYAYGTGPYAGQAEASIWPGNYQGWAWLVVDEVDGPYTSIPLPATTWDHIYVC
jgi:hypothetical protein